MLNPIPDVAAIELANARIHNHPIDRLPESSRPRNNEEALLIQQAVVHRLGDRIGGWKCSLPRGENIFLAPLLLSTLRRGSPCPIIAHNGIAAIEPEVAFVLGRELGPKAESYTVDEVKSAISEARLGLELIGSRFVDTDAISFPEFLADSINNQGLCVGPLIDGPLDERFESFEITVSGPSGKLFTREGRHPNGHPLHPLVWLANFLCSRGETLSAGQIITTGSYAGILNVPLSVPLTVTFGDIGSLSVLLAPEPGL